MAAFHSRREDGKVTGDIVSIKTPLQTDADVMRMLVLRGTCAPLRHEETRTPRKNPLTTPIRLSARFRVAKDSPGSAANSSLSKNPAAIFTDAMDDDFTRRLNRRLAELAKLHTAATRARTTS